MFSLRFQIKFPALARAVQIKIGIFAARKAQCHLAIKTAFTERVSFSAHIHVPLSQISMLTKIGSEGKKEVHMEVPLLLLSLCPVSHQNFLTV